jgi:hypothetical protein
MGEAFSRQRGMVCCAAISLLLILTGCVASNPGRSDDNRNNGFYGGMTGGGVGLP